MITLMGEKMIFGVHQDLMDAPIVNLPKGGKVVRFRMRFKQIATAFVKVGNEVRQYHLSRVVGGIKLASICGINRKET